MEREYCNECGIEVTEEPQFVEFDMAYCSEECMRHLTPAMDIEAGDNVKLFTTFVPILKAETEEHYFFGTMAKLTYRRPDGSVETRCYQQAARFEVQS